MLSAWLVGQVIDMPAQTFSAGGNDVTIPAGSYYLRHSTTAISLIDIVKGRLIASGLAGANVVVTRGRRVLISADGAWTLDWDTATVLQTLLGFAAGGVGATSYLGSKSPTLLWSPGKRELPREAPLGCLGHEKHNAYFSQSPRDGSTSVVRNGSITTNTFYWTMVPTARYQTAAKDPGTWERFFGDVLVRGGRFHLYRDIDELDGNFDAVTWTDSLGPYVLRPGRQGPDWAFQRASGFTWTDKMHSVELACVVTPELTEP